MKYPLYTVFLLAISFSSCDQIKSTFMGESEDENLFRTHYKSGKIKSEVSIDENRKRHGILKQYYETGSIMTEIHYDHGEKLKAVQYYENGNKQMEFFYKDGKKHGKRKKYWENGEIQSILEYYEDSPKMGLEEHNKQGEKIMNYPTLEVKHIDNLDISGEYVVQVYFSKNKSRGNYYLGKLNNGVLGHRAVPLKESNYKGIITYRPAPGTFLMEKINVIGQYRTPLGNPYIVQKTVNIAIDF